MSTDAPIIGRTLAGRFRITSIIGEGGMATVYRAEQDGDPPAVAVKIMSPELALDPKFVKRFRREAKSAALLQHPSTVKIFDYGVEDGLPYIAMELLAGAELVAILHHEKQLAEARAAKIIAEVLSALSMAHEQGIVHRDLKPENIMIVRRPDRPGTEVVKVLDFGIAKIINPDLHAPALPQGPDDPPPSSMGRTALTMMGTIVGTPEYMSPEQSRGGVIDARSDVYACGVLLFHLVTGQVPFQAKLPFETAMLHITAQPPRPSSIVPKIHPGLEALILKALEKSPDNRPESARAMQEALIELLPELSTTRWIEHTSVSPDSTEPAEPAPPGLVQAHAHAEQAHAEQAHAARVQLGAGPTQAAPGPTRPGPTISDGESTVPLSPGLAPTQPGDEPSMALAATMMMDEATSPPLFDRAPVRASNPAPMRPQGGLSSTAALLIGVGLGALVLAILAFLVLRR